MRRVVVLAVVAVLAMSLMPTTGAGARPSQHLKLPPLTPVETDALTAALDSGRLSDAEYALHRARSLFRLGAVRREFGSVERPDGHSATLILRDLALRLSKLSGAERDEAEAVLARPTQGGTSDGYLEYSVAEETPVETQHFRIHWVSSTSDQSTPSYATEVGAIMEAVYLQEVTVMDWLAPKSDGALGGGTDKFDVYLGNVGADFLYGYCATDPNQTAYSVHSYCVLDNGFTEFPAPVTGSAAAKVTAAHEFHHAIQFTYDVSEDYWLSEATSTWMEDEVYNDINDNYQYLTASSMSRPKTPADSFITSFSGPDAGFQYGQFVWMRYLDEHFGDAAAVREIWEAAAATSSGGGKYSLQAMSTMLSARGTDFATRFVDFMARNTDPSLSYSEGAAYEQVIGTPPRHASHLLAGNAGPVSGSVADADHLSAEFISLKPGSEIGTTEQISIAVNMGTAPSQKAAVVNIANGQMTVEPVPLTNGEGNITVDFGGQTEVVLVLSNASTRMANCGSGNFSCSGNPVDDNQKYTWAAALGSTAPDPGDPGSGGEDDQAPVISNLTATPTTLRANGRRKTRIQFHIDENARVKVAIRNSSGSRVFNFTAQITQGEGDYYFHWRGQNNKGRLVPKGRYKVKLTPTDAEGNVGRTASVSITVKR